MMHQSQLAVSPQRAEAKEDMRNTSGAWQNDVTQLTHGCTMAALWPAHRWPFKVYKHPL